MSRIIKWLLFMFFLSALCSGSGRAQTINAKTCSASDVQTALNGVAADGTTVIIPSGNCTWNSVVTFNNTHSYTVQGQTTVAGTCAPGGTCTPTDGTTITLAAGGTALQISTTAGKSQRLTGLTFISASGSAPGYGKINITGGSTAFRFDHSHFDDQTGGNHTFNVDAINGVFDHNYFDSSNSSNTFFFQPSNYGPDGNANLVWTQPENFGTSNFVFIENNFFQRGTFAYDCDYGARMVFRFNVVGTNTRIQTHAVGSGQERRGCRAIENYQSTFQFSASPNGNNTSTYFAFLVDYESGTGMWWGNTVTGFQSYLREDTVRTNNSTYGQTAPPGGWGFCGTNLGPSAWDGNNISSGDPCLDQIGRGAGDLLTGSFPNKIDQATGSIHWPNQALVPTYAWNTTVNQFPNIGTVCYWCNFGPTVSFENTDYYLQLPNNQEVATFNGTAGIGQGTLAARPSTCTPKVGYWATDQGSWNQSGSGGQGQFYVCTATNTWTLYYTPYTYPHPLTVGSGTPPAPPTGLQGIVH